MHYKMFNSIISLYPLYSRVPPQFEPKMSPDITKCILGGKTAPVENHYSIAFQVQANSKIFVANNIDYIVTIV